MRSVCQARGVECQASARALRAGVGMGEGPVPFVVWPRSRHHPLFVLRIAAGWLCPSTISQAL